MGNNAFEAQALENLLKMAMAARAAKEAYAQDAEPEKVSCPSNDPEVREVCDSELSNLRPSDSPSKTGPPRERQPGE